MVLEICGCYNFYLGMPPVTVFARPIVDARLAQHALQALERIRFGIKGRPRSSSMRRYRARCNSAPAIDLAVEDYIMSMLETIT